MSNEKIFEWMQEERLITEFVDWAKATNEKPISRITYLRATQYRDKEKPLTPRQQKALREAQRFFELKTSAPSAN